MIELTKQYLTLDSGKQVLVEANATETGQIFYDVNCGEGLTDQEYEQAVSQVSGTAEKALRSRTIFG
jgi:hypothetical protein